MKIIIQENKIIVEKKIEELRKEVKSLKEIGFETFITNNFLGIGIKMPVMRKRNLKINIVEKEKRFIDDINAFLFHTNTFNLALFRALKTRYEIPIDFTMFEMLNFLRALEIALKIKNFKKYIIKLDILKLEGFTFEPSSSFIKQVNLEASYE